MFTVATAWTVQHHKEFLFGSFNYSWICISYNFLYRSIIVCWELSWFVVLGSFSFTDSSYELSNIPHCDLVELMQILFPTSGCVHETRNIIRINSQQICQGLEIAKAIILITNSHVDIRICSIILLKRSLCFQWCRWLVGKKDENRAIFIWEYFLNSFLIEGNDFWLNENETEKDKNLCH